MLHCIINTLIMEAVSSSEILTTFTKLDRATSQTRAIFILVAVRPSNLTKEI
jgi:hypothetical protein